MNKEEFERLDKLAADALDEIGNEDFDRIDKLKIGQLLRVNKTLFDLTRQLTRLADLAEPTKLILADKSPPSPDALVEAVKRVEKGLKFCTDHRVVCLGDAAIWLKILEQALAAHERGERP